MDERFVKKFIAPSFIIVILSTIFFYEFKYLIDQIFFKKKHILIIGILSAPENFQQRQSIRKTWLQLISEISGSSYFVIGNEICDVPPLDRPDPYSCIGRPFVLPSNVTADTEFTTMEIYRNQTNFSTPIPNYIGFGFYVRSPIRVKKLGILKQVMTEVSNEVQVKLISSYNKKVLASVTFEPVFENETESDLLLKAIKPVTLPENSEVVVRIETNDVNNMLLPECKLAFWADDPKVIHYLNLWQAGSVMPNPFAQKSCVYVSMSYSIVDIEGVKNSIKTRNVRLKEWRLNNKKLSLRLTNESKIYNDILFLDVVDVYRNISLKLTQFYKKILETEYFHYVLKTDDDAFIDLLRVHNQLNIVNKEIDDELGLAATKYKEIGYATKQRLSRFWWWSWFREYWRVQHAGKWRENLYRSASYPSFPCGGGYVVNKGIVDYIVSNEQNLNYFQGEDVSMGIWLSSLPVVHYKTPNVISNKSHELQKRIFIKYKGKQSWAKFKLGNNFAPDICDWTCDNTRNFKLPVCNKVQMTVQSMYDTWNEYIKNGFL